MMNTLASADKQMFIRVKSKVILEDNEVNNLVLRNSGSGFGIQVTECVSLFLRVIFMSFILSSVLPKVKQNRGNCLFATSKK